jgi:GxxExxY protein
MTLIGVRVDNNFKYSELTDTVIGVFYDVYNELGFGFLESVYRNALRLALLEKGLTIEEEVTVSVFFRGQNVGDFRADLVVNGVLLLELKTAERIVPAHEAQLLNLLAVYFAGTGTCPELRPSALGRRFADWCSKMLVSICKPGPKEGLLESFQISVISVNQR